MATTQMNEAQAANLLRNALVVAGMEMGAEGDHWPVIKATAFSIMKDYEDWQIENNVFAEVKKHYENMVRELQALRDVSPDGARQEIDHAIIALLELYNASFSPIDEDDIYIDEDKIPLHMKRAKKIIDTLGDDDGITN